MNNSLHWLENPSIEQHSLPYQKDPHQVFACIADLEWPALLESNQQHVDGRYDIITAAPLVKLSHELTDHEPAFSRLQTLAQSVNLPKHKAPFIAGLLGYLSYDLARELETLPQLAHNDIDFPAMTVGLYHWSLITCHQEKTTTLYYAHLTKTPSLSAEQLLERLQKPVALAPAKIKVTASQSNMSRLDYQQKFARVKQHLQVGDCYQINLAQRFTADYQAEEFDLYRLLQRENPVPFAAFLHYPHGSLLSLSPERFIALAEDGKVESKPIKGTRPRSHHAKKDKALAEELLASEKDRAENLMIVDLLRNDLGKCCQPGSIDVPKLFALESFANVHHLVSTITAKLAADKNAIDLLAACFPGGSITGAPKLRAMEIIEQLEPHRRHAYCGSIFYLDFSGKLDSNIAIRTVVAAGKQLHYWAGGGLVLDSDVDAEYQETFDKVSAIQAALHE